MMFLEQNTGFQHIPACLQSKRAVRGDIALEICVRVPGRMSLVQRDAAMSFDGMFVHRGKYHLQFDEYQKHVVI